MESKMDIFNTSTSQLQKLMSGDTGEETTNITGTRHTLPFLKDLST